MTPHVHAEIIKAWADGETIQFRQNSSIVWHDCAFGCTPAFDLNMEYRVKPQPQFVTQEYHIYLPQGAYVPTFTTAYPSNLRLTFEAGRLIDVELIGNA